MFPHPGPAPPHVKITSAPLRLTHVIDTIGRLPQSLVSARARQKLKSVTDHLPASLSNRLYFECRLAPDDSQVDLVVSLDESNRDALLASEASGVARLRATPVWRGVLQLFAEWANARSLPGTAIKEVWLEFDAVPTAAVHESLPIPGVFLAFSRDTTPADVLSATLDGFAYLRNSPFSREVADTVARAIRRLEPPARVEYAGLMCSRNLDTVRLCISQLRHDGLLRYLDAVWWPGRLDELVTALDAVRCASVPDPLARIALLHVDVGQRTEPRLGMEICFDRRQQLRGTTRERDLLDRLCQCGLCSVDKRDGLLGWPGHSLERFAHEPGPSVVVRRVNGLKLVHVPGRTLEAKAYFTAFHQVRHAIRAAS